MRIDRIDTLSAQREALTAAEGEREGVYAERVAAPLRPFFTFFGPNAEPAATARMLGIYGAPEHDVATGLAALDKLERSGAQKANEEALRRAWAAMRPDERGVAIEPVAFSLALTVLRPGDENGYSGFGAIPGRVMTTVWPTDWNLPRLPSATAHELHHNVRFSVEPWPNPNAVPVGQYMVAEGLAEAFAAELFGEEMLGPWARALSEEQVAEVRPRFRDALEVTGFDTIRGYIFGDHSAAQFGHKALGLPSFAGYTIGYRTVRAYLDRTGRSAAEATYTPWREVVEGAGYL